MPALILYLLYSVEVSELKAGIDHSLLENVQIRARLIQCLCKGYELFRVDYMGFIDDGNREIPIGCLFVSEFLYSELG